MRYTTYGKTGITVSRLGFGAMRLPVKKGADGSEEVDFDESTPLLRHAIEAGINFFDTHHTYHNSQSETAIGYATEGLDRSSFHIQTKNPTWKELGQGETYRSRMEAGLKRAKTDYFDTYLMHSLRWETFEAVGDAFMKEAVQASEEGLIRHIGFSSHDKPENIKRIIDTALFECMLVQYNLIDLVNQDAIRYAREAGLGVAVMGPVAGGRLATPSEIAHYLPGGDSSPSAAALRFVFSNPNVDVAFSGMSAIQQVDENAQTASIETPLSPEEKLRIEEVIAEKQKLADLYCTGCGYCMPCPSGVNIPRVFEVMNWKRLYGLDGPAAKRYARLMKDNEDASQCVECGECLEKCPQNIEIIEQLKESHEALKGGA